MTYRSTPFVLAFLIWLCLGCASGGHLVEPETWGSVFTDRTGLVTESDLYYRLPRVLARLGYFIEEGHGDRHTLLFETNWRTREPFPEERAKGARSARTKLRFRAVWNGRLYALNVDVDNMIADSYGSWVRTRPVDSFLDYARELTGEIRLELATGGRRY